MSGPDAVVEHLLRSGVGAAIVADGSADGIVEQLLAAGWTLDSDATAIVAGKRIRQLVPPPLVTATGKVLTDGDVEALADEAERGYDVRNVKERDHG